MKTILLFLFFLPLPFLAQGTGELRGILTDRATGEPVIFAVVYLKGTSLGVQTDINGFYSLTKIPPGKYELVAVDTDYDTLRKEIAITDGNIVTVSLVLKARHLAYLDPPAVPRDTSGQRIDPAAISRLPVIPANGQSRRRTRKAKH